MYDGETEEEMLAASAQRNNWGQAINLYQAGAASVINVDLPAWMARAWTLNLLRFRYSGGTLQAPPASTNPDAQTIGDDTKVCIDFGVDGAMETVRIDYPRQGGTVQFHAAVIRIYFEAPSFASLTPGIPGQPISLSPLVGAFVTPHVRSGIAEYQPPTFTPVGFIVPLNPTVVLVNIPVRARAYRIVPQGSLNADGLIQNIYVRQMTGAGGALTVDYGQNNSPLTGEPLAVDDGTGTGVYLYPNRSKWIPLVHNAEQIEVSTSDVGVDIAVVVQFLLDLG